MPAHQRKKFWGFSRESILSRHLGLKAEGRSAEVLVHMGKKAVVPKEWREHFHDATGSATALVRVVDLADHPRILISPAAPSDVENDPRLKAKPTTRVRDAMGPLISQLERMDIQSAVIQLELSPAELLAAVTGLEIALYRYKRALNEEVPKFKLIITNKGKPVTAKQVESLAVSGQSVNLARHLTNLPPNELNPVSYADFVRDFLDGQKGLKVDIWDEKRIKKENMGLHFAVGQGSSYPPRLVHIRYRPARSKGAPIAVVGKGITFDTGGLDIKPATGMRLMKKDMGGAAAVLGLAYWASQSGHSKPVDFYLALAENAVSSESFRPSDVLTARNGMTVEIHNTDAEGRLVLADALDVAITNRETPRAVIDVATLTGAIKVALGAGLTGLFANDPKLCNQIVSASHEAGDLVWPMPLFQKYRSLTSSNFADMVNAVDGFGGAVTAALFLEKFVKDVPWAHLDIYAWKDNAEGCWLESGGSGQAVLGLAAFLNQA